MVPLILVIEDETVLAEAISTYLERHKYTTSVAHSGEEGVRIAEQISPEVAVVDIKLPGIDGLDVLRRLRELSPTTEVIMMTAHASVASALEAMKLGAFDYLTKPVDLDELRVIVDKASAHLRMRRELSYLKERHQTVGHVSRIVGESASICALRSQIERIAALEAPEGGVAPTVLIRGETGTGKDMIARSIHYHGPRSAGPFVDINCAAIPPALLEAELFGYERGAYTDAKAAKPGLFEAADGGTLFLDEIGHMELGMQVKLLKALEDRSVRRIGGLRAKTFNVRIVAATNRDLGAAIAEGAFRPDLYYRINTLTLHIPPLRERGDDITLLARHFLESFSQQYGLPAKELAPEAEVAMRSYSWPGNVRELAHVMERAVLLHGGPVVTLEQLGFAETKCQTPVVVEIDGTVRVDFSAGKIVLDEVERQLIYEALRVAGWNRTRAAELLGISKETLRYRMEKYELHPPVKTGES